MVEGEIGHPILETKRLSFLPDWEAFGAIRYNDCMAARHCLRRFYDSVCPCGDVHVTDNRLDQGERPLKTYFPNKGHRLFRPPVLLYDN